MTYPSYRLPPRTSKAIAFDVDPIRLARLREILVGWQIEVVTGATVASLPRDWDPGLADLHIVGLRADVTETLGLCRFLASYRRREAPGQAVPPGTAPHCRPRAAPALLVLVPRDDFCDGGRAACDAASIGARARAGRPESGERPHALPEEGRWHDDGGQ
jgi:hypothetical protein